MTDSVGSLNFRQEVIDGFVSVRQKHEQLQALMHQVMRRVALPRCREIGNDLVAVKSFYPQGKKGSASKFYADAKALTGLSKPSVAGYIQIAENWPRLMDYMTDLPEGATPITSLRGALEAIREMNRPLKPATSADSIDVDAQAIEGGDDQAPATRRTNFASSARKVINQQFSGLKAVKVLTPLHRERLDKIQEMLQLLLDDIDRTEAEAAVPTTVEAKPKLDMSVVAIPEDDTTNPVELPSLKELFPYTQDGLKALEAAIVEHGSGRDLGRHLGNTSKNPSRWIGAHRKRIQKALEA